MACSYEDRVLAIGPPLQRDHRFASRRHLEGRSHPSEWAGLPGRELTNYKTSAESVVGKLLNVKQLWINFLISLLLFKASINNLDRNRYP